jgi:hypothetical protein
VERAARLAGFKVPEGYDPRPKPWQRGRIKRRDQSSSLTPNPYAVRPTTVDQVP